MASMGKSSAKSSQQQQQSSEAYSNALSQSASMGQSTQDVWGSQVPALQSLYANAQQLMGGGGAAAQQQGIMQQAGNAWTQQLTPGGNPYFSQAVQGAIDQATRGFNEGILPGLQNQAVQSGAYGGPRDQLAQGQAAASFGRDLQSMVSQQYAQQYAGDQNRALGALGMAPQLGAMAFQPLQQAQSMIGGPTVLGQASNVSAQQSTAQSQSTSQGSGFGGSTNRAFNFGIGSK